MTIKQILFATLIIGTIYIQCETRYIQISGTSYIQPETRNVPKPIKFTMNLNDKNLIKKLAKIFPASDISETTHLGIFTCPEKHRDCYEDLGLLGDISKNKKQIIKKYFKKMNTKSISCVYCPELYTILLNEEEEDCSALYPAIFEDH